MKWAFETLYRYRKRFCMFNDDIQVQEEIISSKFIHKFSAFDLSNICIPLHVVRERLVLP